MKYLERLADDIRTGAPIAAPIALALTAATPITRLGMAIRRAKKPVRVDARVISFGNITAGGTGKTPAVIERVKQELAAGQRVAVLTRGYGAVASDTTIALAGAEAALQPERVGDEAALIGRHAPEALIVRDADRIRGARVAVERGCDTLVLDDGFQYVQLARDEDIVLIDATNPFGNGRLLPRGILREPVGALARATSIVVTRCDQAADVDAVVSRLRAIVPDIAIRTTQHAPVGLWNADSQKRLPLDMLRDRDVTEVCAIGRPEAFRATLESLGARVTEVHTFRDHAPIDTSRARGAFVVTTEKDAIRMKRGPSHWWALEVALEDWP